MPRAYQRWKEPDLIYLKEHYGKTPIYIISAHLQREEKKIVYQAGRLGFGDSKYHWSEDEDNFLRSNWVTLKAKEIGEKLGRSPTSVRHRAAALHITIERGRAWEPEEHEILGKYAGEVHLAKIKRKLDDLCKDRGWTDRSRDSIARQIYLMRESVVGDQITVHQLTKAIHCDSTSIKRWLLVPAYKEILRPMSDDKTTWFEPKNLRRFMIEYPGEIAKFHPDILWLIGFLCPQRVR